MKLIDPDHPAYRPLWVRVLVVGFSAVWAGFEFMNGNTVWALLFVAIAGYALWKLFINWKPQDRNPD